MSYLPDESYIVELKEILKQDKSIPKSLAVSDVIRRRLGPRRPNAYTYKLSTMLSRIVDDIAEVEQYVLWAIKKEVELRKQEEDHNAASQSGSPVSPLSAGHATKRSVLIAWTHELLYFSKGLQGVYLNILKVNETLENLERADIN